MQTHSISLSDIDIGQSLIIKTIDAEKGLLGRLNELGFSKNAVIDKLYVGYGGSPVAVRVSGAVIAVREGDVKVRGILISKGVTAHE